MPNETSTLVAVRFTSEFKRNLRALSKKYRHIRSDVQPVIEQIQAGNFKTRVRNSDIRKGKSAGYRLIYYLKTSTEVVLITIYSKLDQSDISAVQIRHIVNEIGAES